ncbi:hypothetical protein G6F62_001340 [Rhizopus arrhizus]|nr:hypothetical protein G6F66_001468 [Rhizopus arrhizus]KAG1357739.1 hypothetical protein G6F62_001340 [Rhizopus arrhizus]KAG1405709.1 hypothetical protein G6F60_003431 [Rhizopus arrhizus]
MVWSDFAHGILLFYRSNIANRLSLRLIVLSSAFDSIYSICQIVVDHIDSRSTSCRALAYILISTDTMACMCLAVVGLNLVMIFAVKISTTLKLEMIYYAIVATSGILVSIIPKVAGNKTGPGAVPLISKIWGISIEIAAASNASIPYSVYLLDRLFAGLLGFMVACIYFTDPAICTIFSEVKEAIKRKYVYDYYTILFQPSPDSSYKDDYPKLVKIVNTQIHESRENIRHSVLVNDMKKKQLRDVGSEVDIGEFFRGAHAEKVDLEKNALLPPSVELQIIRGQHVGSAKNYNIVSVTSKNGRSFVPSDNFINENDQPYVPCCQYSSVSVIPLKKAYESTRSSRSDRSNNFPNASLQAKNDSATERLTPFKYPRLARFMHWMLISVVRIKPVKPTSTSSLNSTKEDTQANDNKGDDRIAGVSNNHSDLSSEIKQRPCLTKESSLNYISENQFSPTDITPAATDPSSDFIDSATRELSEKACEDKSSDRSSRRASSINIAILQRSRHYKEESGLHVTLTDDNIEVVPITPNSSSARFIASSMLPIYNIFSKKDKYSASSSMWNTFARPRSKSFASAADIEKLNSADSIELKQMAYAAKSNKELRDAAFCDNYKCNAGLHQVFLNGLSNEELAVREPSEKFSSQLFPRPASQHSKRRIPRKGQDPPQEISSIDQILQRKKDIKKREQQSSEGSKPIIDHSYLDRNSKNSELSWSNYFDTKKIAATTSHDNQKNLPDYLDIEHISSQGHRASINYENRNFELSNIGWQPKKQASNASPQI